MIDVTLRWFPTPIYRLRVPRNRLCWCPLVTLKHSESKSMRGGAILYSHFSHLNSMAREETSSNCNEAI